MEELLITRSLEPFGPAAALILTDDEVAALGGGRRATVLVTIDGRTARLRLAVMGGQNCIGMSKAVRSDLAVDIGDAVVARIELDTGEREVEMPTALVDALDGDPAAKQTFESLAYTHRKDYATWIGEAKRAETRERRVAQALELLRAGRART